MFIRKHVSVALLLLAASCGGASYDPKVVEALQVGETKAQVIAKLGAPDSTTPLATKTDQGCTEFGTWAYVGGPTGAAATIVMFDEAGKVCIKPSTSDGSKK